MKWYKRDPAAALEGMIGLTIEERGAYNTLLDLIYARAPHGSVNDSLVIKALATRPQVWRRLKSQLMAKGKVREVEGKLTANRVETELQTATKLMANLSRIGAVSELKRAEFKHLANEPNNFGSPHNHNHNQILSSSLATATSKKEESSTANESGRSVASALPTGALPPSPSNEQAEARKPSDKKIKPTLELEENVVQRRWAIR